MWPTPTAQEERYNGDLGTDGHIRGLEKSRLTNWAKEKDQKNGQLNPAWVCWLMGYTLDYLDLDGWQNPELDGLPAEYLTEPKS